MNQKNLIAILGVAVVILLGTTIYFATISNLNQLTPDTATQTPAQLTPASTQNYIEVKELSFKIPVDASSANEITYTVNQATQDNPNSSVAFSTKTLNAMDKDCEQGSIGAILKVSGRATTDPNGENFVPGEIKQFQDFFLAFQTPQSPCHSGDNSVDREFMQVIRDGFEDTVLITQFRCDNYKNFQDENWYPSLLEKIIKEDKIDKQGVEWLQMISSQLDPGSNDNLVEKEGKIIESDMVKICKLNEKEIIAITRQENDLNYLFAFAADSNELTRANGVMIIDESEQINTPETKENYLVIKTTVYGDNNAVWEKVFNYNSTDNSVHHVETCKLEQDKRSCKSAN